MPGPMPFPLSIPHSRKQAPRSPRATGIALGPRFVFALSGLALGLATGASAEEKVIDGIAAQVGSEIVLISEVQKISAPIEQKMRDAGVPESEVVVMRADALERLIETSLIDGVVRQLELGATEAEVDNAIDSIAANAGLSKKQLIQSITSHGLTYEEYRGKIASEIERSKVLNSMVRSQVKISPEEVQALYDQKFGNQRNTGSEVHLRWLLVTFGAQSFRDRNTACSTVDEARAEITSGQATFGELVRKLSDNDPAILQRGGDLGWIHEDEIAGWMGAGIRGLEDGQLSETIETRFGCNLLEVVERRSFEPVVFEQVKPGLEDEIFNRKTEEEYLKWVETLRERTYVERKGAMGARPPDDGLSFQ